MNTIQTQGLQPLTHREAMALQARELELTVTMLRSLDEGDWESQTDCPEWDVRTMYQHVLGACEAGASMRENAHQMRLGYAHRRRHGGPLEAALSNVQVREREELEPHEIVTRLEQISDKAIRGRSRTPGLFRNHLSIAIDGPVHEKWKLGYLIDTIYLRDLWMHRVDTSHATGRPLELSSEHDGRLIADVVAEWARRHARPFALDLDGPAGGNFATSPPRPRPSTSPSTPSNSVEPSPDGYRQTGCWRRSSRSDRATSHRHNLTPHQGVIHEYDHRPDRRRHLPHLDIRPRHRVVLQPDSRRGRRTVAVPPRHARPVPGSARSGGTRDAARPPSLAEFRPCRGRRVRGDEPMVGSSPECRGRLRRAGLHGVGQTIWRTAHRQPSTTSRCSTSAANDCATWQPRMCPTAGKPACSSKRRPRRCCAATSSPRAATGRRSVPTHRSLRPSPRSNSSDTRAVPRTPPRRSIRWPRSSLRHWP